MKLTILSGIVLAAIMLGAAVGNNEGHDAFEKRCTGCHTLDKIKLGPPLRGVFGRKAGMDPQFEYSDAVKKAAVTWDEATLGQWLTDTNSVIPGNDMAFRLNDSKERTAIVAYLKELRNK
jgi:cytochrome c